MDFIEKRKEKKNKWKDSAVECIEGFTGIEIHWNSRRKKLFAEFSEYARRRETLMIEPNIIDHEFSTLWRER